MFRRAKDLAKRGVIKVADHRLAGLISTRQVRLLARGPIDELRNDVRSVLLSGGENMGNESLIALTVFAIEGAMATVFTVSEHWAAGRARKTLFAHFEHEAAGVRRGVRMAIAALTAV